MARVEIGQEAVVQSVLHGQYHLIRRIAVGGMGEIFLAHQHLDPGLPSRLVVKKIRNCFADDPRIVPMFLQEARIGLALEHPNVVRVFDLARHRGGYFIVMEHVAGLSLHRCLREHEAPLPPPFAIKIAAEIAAGLQYVHERTDRAGRSINLVHRDISPGNVLLSFEGDVKVTDFGIAKFRLASHRTQVGVIKGKFAYLSPEQARGEPVDHRADIFSLGLVLYEMTTGQRAYVGDDLTVLDRAALGQISSPETVVADYPPELREVLMRCLAREPSDRYASCEELQQDLLLLLAAGEPPTMPTAAALGGLVRTLARSGRERERGSDPEATAEIALDPVARAAGKRTSERSPRFGSRQVMIAGAGITALAVFLFALRFGASNPAAVVPRPSIVSADTSIAAAATSITPAATSATSASATSTAAPTVSSEAGIEPASSGVAPGKVELARSSRQRAPGQGRRQHLAAVRSSRSLSRAARPVVPSAAPRLALPFRAPAQGKLVFDLKPGLHVRLDGRPLGQTPLAPIWVDEGRRTLLVTSPFRYRTKRYQVVIRAGRTASVSSDEG